MQMLDPKSQSQQMVNTAQPQMHYPVQYPIASMGKPVFIHEKSSGEIVISDKYEESIVGYKHMPSYIVYIPIQVVPRVPSELLETTSNETKSE